MDADCIHKMSESWKVTHEKDVGILVKKQ